MAKSSYVSFLAQQRLHSCEQGLCKKLLRFHELFHTWKSSNQADYSDLMPLHRHEQT